MSSFHDEIGARLRRLAADGLYRRLETPQGIDFSSNDYLGLAGHPEVANGVRERLERAAAGGDALGTPASRLLRGHRSAHAELERRLADLKGMPRALLFSSGYQANVGVLGTLVGRGDRALSDALNHASLIDGLRLAGCRKEIFPHRDVDAVERLMAAPFPGRTFLVTESLFSMDGTIAPLGRYTELCARHGAELIVDDAHAVGVYGDDRGSGLIERFGVTERVLAATSTFGKACGLGGAFVAAAPPIIDYLVNACRTFIFTTAPPPLLLFALDATLDVLAAEPWRRRRVLELAARLRTRLRRAGLDPGGDDGPIVPVVLGANEAALAVASAAREAGFDVRAVRPPTVPPGTARLRLSVHADRSEEEIDRLAEVLSTAAVAALAVAG